MIEITNNHHKSELKVLGMEIFRAISKSNHQKIEILILKMMAILVHTSSHRVLDHKENR